MAEKKLYRQTFVRVDLNSLRNNFSKIRDIANMAVMPVVKADAYGHGAVNVAKALEEEGADILGVATIEEGIELRENGIRLPVLILGSIYPMENFEAIIEYDLTPIVASRFSAESLENTAKTKNKKVAFHLKVDSGMGRIGLSPDSAVKLWNEIEDSMFLSGEGILTHFSRADEDAEYTIRQIDAFKSVISRLHNIPKFVHAANTAGIMNFSDSYFTLLRPGLAVYGLYPDGVRNEHGFKPVLSWHSSIVFLKDVPEGTPISYGGTWVAPARSRIATLCVGYADGYRRALSNKSKVIIRGKKCPVIGRVCMDMIMVDVTDVKGVSIGDEAVLIGSDSGESITVEEMASWAETINYEITTGITGRVPRIYSDD
ncbi:MAG: alanine racemase [Elusimicrobiota bacterium]